MGLKSFARNIVNTATGGLTAPIIGGSSSYKENLKSLYSGDFGRSIDENAEVGSINNPTNEQITTANLFKNLTPEQQKILAETTQGKAAQAPAKPTQAKTAKAA